MAILLEANVALTLLIATVIFFTIRSLQETLRRRTFSQLHNCLPPAHVPQWDPILGLDILVAQLKNEKAHRLLENITSQHSSLGGTFSFTVFGERVIMTIEPENIQAFHITKFEDLSVGKSRYKQMHDVLGEGVFISDGARWRNARSLVRPFFNHKIITNVERMEVHMKLLLARIQDAGIGAVVDLQDLFLRLTLDLSTEMLFGKSVGSLAHRRNISTSRSLQEFVDSFDEAKEIMGRRARVGLFYPLIAPRKFKKLATVIHGMVDKQLEELERNIDAATDEEDRFSLLRHMTEREDDKRLVRDNAINVLLAARDTSGGTLGMIFHCLARHPAVWSKLEAEVIGEKSIKTLPTTRDIQIMPYLRSIVLESTLIKIFQFYTLNTEH